MNIYCKASNFVGLKNRRNDEEGGFMTQQNKDSLKKDYILIKCFLMNFVQIAFLSNIQLRLADICT